MKASIFLLASLIIGSCSNAQESENRLPSCQWCGATEAPQNLQNHTQIADESEKGIRIKISGKVFLADKKTPANGVVLYLYHTNIEGIYSKRGNETGNGRRHGYLRGWIKTDEDGRYSFETIKPEPYPGRTTPAHIHITIKEPGKDEYWLKDFFFEGDELLTAQHLQNETGDSRFNHVIQLQKTGDLHIGKRDILLKD